MEDIAATNVNHAEEGPDIWRYAKPKTTAKKMEQEPRHLKKTKSDATRQVCG